MEPEEIRKKPARIRRVAVYLGAHGAEDRKYADGAATLGKFLADHDMTLVYGGSNTGIMKILADTVIENGGKAVGVFTRNLPEELLHRGLTETIIARTLAERKALMLARADAVIALPGSFGTWDELFDALALRKIPRGGIHCPIGILNLDGYYDHLLAFIEHSVRTGFTAPEYGKLLKSGRTVEELFRLLAAGME